jgi:hypothetical protein
MPNIDEMLTLSGTGLSLRMGGTLPPTWSLTLDAEVIADLMRNGGSLEWKNQDTGRVALRMTVDLAGAEVTFWSDTGAISAEP